MRKDIGKRIFDIAFSTVVLFLGSPVFLLLAILIKCTSKGPVFYASPRIGLHGKPITCWKFRTMRPDADSMLEQILISDPEKRKEWQENFKIQSDKRITTLGFFLRKTSLDELPQFWNVLIGDLSVVGPRPVSAQESVLFLQTKGEKIFSIKPGITGLWQTSGRNALSYRERMDLEERYVDTRSFLLDLWLILKTIPCMIFPKGAS